MKYRGLIIIIFIFKSIFSTNSAITEKIFTEICEGHKWGSKESSSGNGSTLSKTVSIRKYLTGLVKRLEIKTLLDAPCGDFNWMKLIINKLNLDLYIGVDIVEKLIKENNKLYSNKKIRFVKLDIINNAIPQVDLIICRDCLVHLPYEDIVAVLKNFKQSGSTYLLMTTFS